MKLETNTKLNRFQKRALHDFTAGMMELLQEQSFESITVNTICDRCSYPRSTFYNYFEDLYDLLDYTWSVSSDEIFDEATMAVDEAERMDYIFHRIFVFMKERELYLNRMMRNNAMDGAMMQSLRTFMCRLTSRLIRNCSLHQNLDIPGEMYVEHFTNTTVLLIEWSFLKPEKLTEEQAFAYYKYLLGNLQ